MGRTLKSPPRRGVCRVPSQPPFCEGLFQTVGRLPLKRPRQAELTRGSLSGESLGHPSSITRGFELLGKPLSQRPHLGTMSHPARRIWGEMKALVPITHLTSSEHTWFSVVLGVPTTHIHALSQAACLDTHPHDSHPPACLQATVEHPWFCPVSLPSLPDTLLGPAAA